MPAWVVVLGACAFVVTSVLTLWTKAIRPGAKVISEFERMLPVWRSATDSLEDVPAAFAILKEIVAQVRNNSGSTILDMVEKLSRQADVDRAEHHSLAVSLEADRRLAVRDREQMTRLLLQQDQTVNRLDATITALTQMATADRMVATNLSVAQKQVDGVASDLAGQHRRADAVIGEPPGAAADAASQSGR